VLLLDEPTSGVSKDERESLGQAIRAWHTQNGTAMIVIDHDVHFVSSLCARCVVLSSGELLAQGSIKEVLSNVNVVRDFLGIDNGTSRD